MASYPPPTTNLPIFNSQSFATPTASAGGSSITIPFLDANYLQFPLAQSALETIPNLAVSVSGTAPTKVLGTNTTDIATCAFVIENAGGGGAPLDSPVFTGIPEAPTAAVATNTTQLATCEFVLANMGGVGVYAPLNSPAFTGTPTAPTVVPSTDDTTTLATTAFVQSTLTTMEPAAQAPIEYSSPYGVPLDNVVIPIDPTWVSMDLECWAEGGMYGTSNVVSGSSVWEVGGGGGGGSYFNALGCGLSGTGGTVNEIRIDLNTVAGAGTSYVAANLNGALVFAIATLSKGDDGGNSSLNTGGDGGNGGTCVVADIPVSNLWGVHPQPYSGTTGNHGGVFGDGFSLPVYPNTPATANISYPIVGYADGGGNEALVGDCYTDTGINFPQTLPTGAFFRLTPYILVPVPKYAAVDSPAFIGTPTAPTVVPNTDDTTKIATTAFVQSTLTQLIPDNPIFNPVSWTYFYESDYPPNTDIFFDFDPDITPQYLVFSIGRGGNCGTSITTEAGQWSIGGAGGGGSAVAATVATFNAAEANPPYNQISFNFFGNQLTTAIAFNGTLITPLATVNAGQNGENAVDGIGASGGNGGAYVGSSFVSFAANGTAGTAGGVFNDEVVIPPVGGSNMFSQMLGFPNGVGVSNPALVGNCGTVPQNIAADPLDPALRQACVVLIPFSSQISQKYASNYSANLLGFPTLENTPSLSNGGSIVNVVLLVEQLILKANVDSPVLTGIPEAPTAAVATNTTQIATCEFVIANAGGGGAPLDSPVFTGIPEAPTAAVATNTTQLATCAFVIANAGGGGAPLDSPAFTGTPTAPTVVPSTDDTTTLATTAFVQSTLTVAGSPTPLAPIYSIIYEIIAIDPAWVSLDIKCWAEGGNAGASYTPDPPPFEVWTTGAAGGSGGAFSSLSIPILANYKYIQNASSVGGDTNVSILNETYGEVANIGTAYKGQVGDAATSANFPPFIIGGGGGAASVGAFGATNTAFTGTIGGNGGVNYGSGYIPVNPFNPAVSYVNAGLTPPTYLAISNWGQGGRLPNNITGSVDGVEIIPDPFLAIAPAVAITEITPYVANPQSKYALKNNTILTGIPTAPTPLPNDISTQIATTQFVANEFAPLISPELTGVPLAPTAVVGTDTTQIATTEFVNDSITTAASQTKYGSFVITQTITGAWDFNQVSAFTIAGTATAITYDTPSTTTPYLNLHNTGTYTINLRVNYISGFNGDELKGNNFGMLLYNSATGITDFPLYSNYSSSHLQLGDIDTPANFIAPIGNAGGDGVVSTFPAYLQTAGAFVANWNYISATFKIAEVISPFTPCQLQFGSTCSSDTYTVSFIDFTITYNGVL